MQTLCVDTGLQLEHLGHTSGKPKPYVIDSHCLGEFPWWGGATDTTRAGSPFRNKVNALFRYEAELQI